MTLAKAELANISKENATPIQVLFNPTEYSIDRGANYAELQVPGTDNPVLQFVRADAQTLTVELFLDGTSTREPIERKLSALRELVVIDDHLHAPPVCQFRWGTTVSVGPVSGAQENRFTGVVTSLRERHTLFDENGRILRSRVTLTLKSYRAPETQRRETPLASPDRTHVRVFREGETLSRIANELYGDPRQWRAIATENDIDRPRFVDPGTALRVPSLGGRR
jgi:nucleoid-associated protein YgaU